MAPSFLSSALWAAVAVTSVSATPRSVADHVVSRASGQEPCAQIASIFSNKQNLYVPADTALACLQSVPLDKTGGTQQLAGLQALTGFQSDLSYLIKPPPGYLYPAVDVQGGLTQIGKNLDSGAYSNEYDFQLDIYKLIASTYDGHFNYAPDIINVFAFVRLFSENIDPSVGMPDFYSVISISKDGTSVPETYSLLDALALIEPDGARYTPSPIAQINGEDAETWLNTYAATSGGGRQQDPDAQYNFLFPNIPTSAVPSLVGAFGNNFAVATVYQGTDTVLKFQNGTTQHVTTEAYSSSDNRAKFSQVKDGASFFQTFCTGDVLKQAGGGSSVAPSASRSAPAFASSSAFLKRDAALTARAPQASSGGAFSSGVLSSIIPQSGSFLPSSALASGSASAPAVPSSQVPYQAIPTTPINKQTSQNFPKPFVASDDLAIAGYFPKDEDDLVVIAIPSYEPVSNSQFSNVVREVLATAKKYGRTKLIIDLRGNPGGRALLATDTFKQLFPSLDPYGAGNYRANTLFDFAGQSLTEYFATHSDAEAEQAGLDSLEAGTPFNAENEVTKAAKDFPDWESFYGPNYIHGDNYTALTRWNLSDTEQRQGIYIYGYGNNDKPQPQTFQAENIVMLSDGACASTCTLFAELMKNQGHVRSIAVGGRAKTGPMQAVGGIKGANVLGMATMFDILRAALALASTTLQKQFLAQVPNAAQLVQQTVKALSRAAPDPSNVVAATFNFRNNFRQGDTTTTPLQYVYEAADWRFFYTAQMYVDQSQVWSKTYDIVWKSGDAVEGSTGQRSSTFGTGYILDPPPSGVASDESIFPSKSLGKAVKPSSTAGFGKGGTGAATSLGVSKGLIVAVLGVAVGMVML